MKKNWKKIPNRWAELPGYDCFVCSPGHDWGFRLEFFLDPDEDVVVSPVPPVKEGMAGFPGILHGGFQAMLLDEVMCWAVAEAVGKTCFTGKMEVRYSKPLHTGEPLLLKARVTAPGRRLCKCEAWLEDERGEELCSGSGSYVIPSLEEFRENIGTVDIPESLNNFFR